MPNLPEDKLAAKLAQSPLLKDAKALGDAFPTQREIDAHIGLAANIDESIAKNKSVEETWESISKTKEVALKLLGLALGRPL